MMATSALVVSTSRSAWAGSQRTSAPPWPLAEIAMLPPIRNASPPNIRRSVTSGSAARSPRIRSARTSSYAMATMLGSRPDSPSVEAAADPPEAEPHQRQRQAEEDPGLQPLERPVAVGRLVRRHLVVVHHQLV